MAFTLQCTTHATRVQELLLCHELTRLSGHVRCVCCRRQAQKVVTDDFSDKAGPYVQRSSPSKASNSGGADAPPSTWGGSALELTRTGMSNSSLGTARESCCGSVCISETSHCAAACYPACRHCWP